MKSAFIKNMKKAFATCLLALLALPNLAYSLEGDVKACVKYQRSDYSWSNEYKVVGYLVSGSELNSMANTYKFSSYDNYYVILWKEGGYTALKLPYRELPYSWRTVEDQRDKTWEIKEGWSSCY